MARNRPLTLAERIQIGATRLGISFEAYRAHVLNDEKWCSACPAWHACAEFGARRTTVDGLDNLCRTVSRTKAKRNMARLRAERRQSA